MAAPGPSFQVPIMDDNNRYELVRDIGSGNFSVARLMRDKLTSELVAVKYIERGERIDENVKREIVNHRSLRHPNIIKFKEVFLTQTHLAIVMEFAAGGELFDRIFRAKRFHEDEARYFFQQLISGVSYCHSMEICHRDLKLENTLLDGSPAPRLKICDFGYSKSSVLHSQPKSTVGTPAYIAPEVLSKKEYDGKVVYDGQDHILFEDPEEPRNFRKTIRRILNVQYTIPGDIPLSSGCQELISRIFVADPTQRITMAEIKAHPWFLKNLPADLAEGAELGPEYRVEPAQSVQEIDRIITEASTLIINPNYEHYLSDENIDFDDMDFDNIDSDLSDDID